MKHYCSIIKPMSWSKIQLNTSIANAVVTAEMLHHAQFLWRASKQIHENYPHLLNQLRDEASSHALQKLTYFLNMKNEFEFLLFCCCPVLKEKKDTHESLFPEFNLYLMSFEKVVLILLSLTLTYINECLMVSTVLSVCGWNLTSSIIRNMTEALMTRRPSTQESIVSWRNARAISLQLRTDSYIAADVTDLKNYITTVILL